MPRQTLIDKQRLQLAVALSNSLEESKKQELSKLTEELPASSIELGNVPQDITELQREFLQKFQGQQPGPNKKAKKLSKPSKPVPALLSRNAEEKIRIVTEKVALVLIKDGNKNTHGMNETNHQHNAASQQENILWNVSSESSTKSKKYYSDKLMSRFVPSIESVRPTKTLVVPERLFSPVKCMRERLQNESPEHSSSGSLSLAQNNNSMNHALQGQCELQMDWSKMLHNAKYSDVTIIVKEKTHIYAHKVVLYTRCPAIIEDIDSDNLLRWTNVPRSNVLVFLNYIYCGKLNTISMDEGNTGLVYLANKYKLTSLLKSIFITDMNSLEGNEKVSTSISKDINRGVVSPDLFADTDETESDKQDNDVNHISEDADTCINVSSEDENIVENFFGTYNPTLCSPKLHSQYELCDVQNSNQTSPINSGLIHSDQSVVPTEDIELQTDLPSSCISMKSPLLQKNKRDTSLETSSVEPEEIFISSSQDSMGNNYPSQSSNEMMVSSPTLCSRTTSPVMQDKSPTHSPPVIICHREPKEVLKREPKEVLKQRNVVTTVGYQTSPDSSSDSSSDLSDSFVRLKEFVDGAEILAQSYIEVKTSSECKILHSRRGKKRKQLSPTEPDVIAISSSSDDSNTKSKALDKSGLYGNPSTVRFHSQRTTTRSRKSLFSPCTNQSSSEDDQDKQNNSFILSTPVTTCRHSKLDNSEGSTVILKTSRPLSTEKLFSQKYTQCSQYKKLKLNDTDRCSKIQAHKSSGKSPKKQISSLVTREHDLSLVGQSSGSREKNIHTEKTNNVNSLLVPSCSSDAINSNLVKDPRSTVSPESKTADVKHCQTPRSCESLETSELSSPVTPMPNYESMNDHQFQAELQKYGLKKNLSKSKGIKMLKYIYEELHPVVEVLSESEGEVIIPIEDKSPFKEVSANARVLGEELPASSGSPSKDWSADETSSSQNSSRSSNDSILLEETIFVEEDQSPNVEPTDLRTVLRSWITNQPEIYEMILSYEPLWLDSLHEELKKLFDKRVSVKELMDVLDEEGITFRTVQGQQSRGKKKTSATQKNASKSKTQSSPTQKET